MKPLENVRWTDLLTLGSLSALIGVRTASPPTALAETTIVSGLVTGVLIFVLVLNVLSIATRKDAKREAREG